MFLLFIEKEQGTEIAQQRLRNRNRSHPPLEPLAGASFQMCCALEDQLLNEPEEAS